MSSDLDSLRIARTFDASRDRVYRAWTDAADLARWYTPADGMTLSIDALDVRVGGRCQATVPRPRRAHAARPHRRGGRRRRARGRLGIALNHLAQVLA
jgi:uncharacterized protein YndB with AHSA1/START domain